MLENARWTTASHDTVCVACRRPLPAGASVYAPGADRVNVFCATCGQSAHAAVLRKRVLIEQGVALDYPPCRTADGDKNEDAG